MFESLSGLFFCTELQPVHTKDINQLVRPRMLAVPNWSQTVLQRKRSSLGCLGSGQSLWADRLKLQPPRHPRCDGSPLAHSTGRCCAMNEFCNHRWRLWHTYSFPKSHEAQSRESASQARAIGIKSSVGRPVPYCAVSGGAWSVTPSGWRMTKGPGMQGGSCLAVEKPSRQIRVVSNITSKIFIFVSVVGFS